MRDPDTYYSILSLFNPFLSLILLGIAITVAVYAVKHFPGTASNLIMLGVVIKCIQFLFSNFLQYYLMSSLDIKEMNTFFALSGSLWILGQFLFLIGLFQLLKAAHHKMTSSET